MVKFEIGKKRRSNAFILTPLERKNDKNGCEKIRVRIQYYNWPESRGRIRTLFIKKHKNKYDHNYDYEYVEYNHIVDNRNKYYTVFIA